MNKKLVAATGVLLLLAGASAWFYGKREPVADRLVLHGNVDIRQVSLAFEGSGRVLEMSAQEGDRAPAGALLARLDTRTLQLQAQQVEARIEAQRQSTLRLRNGARPEELAQARARLAAAEAEATRQHGEVARLQEASRSTAGRAVSEREMEAASTAMRAADARVVEQREALRLLQLGSRSEEVGAAEAQLRALRAELALLRHRAQQGELRAPVSGIVRSRLLEPGDLASPQKPAYTLALTEPKWVRVYVNESNLGQVRPGAAAQVSTDNLARPVAGRIGYVSSVAEFTPKSVQTEEVRTSLVYEVRVIVQDSGNVLRLGQPATVHIPLPGPASATR